ncbi:MAG: hypothetical protein CMB55_03660 [Euryarchaeota archaeon]|nr:hypothetical protein [Euryarchaeota archaeon]
MVEWSIGALNTGYAPPPPKSKRQKISTSTSVISGNAGGQTSARNDGKVRKIVDGKVVYLRVRKVVRT